MSFTLTEICTQIWEAIGRPTNIDPGTAEGFTALSLAANEAQRQVAGWKDPSTGRRMRMNCLYSSLTFPATTYDNTSTVVNNATFPYSISSTNIRTGDSDDRYIGWILEMTSGNANGERKVITDHGYLGGENTYFLDSAFSSTPTVADTFKLYKSFFSILPSDHAWVADGISSPTPTIGKGNLLEILKIRDINEGFNLTQASGITNFPDKQLNTGSPTQWNRYGNKIFMNYNVDSNKWYELEYYRLPNEMVEEDDYPEIPETYHWAMILWGIWWGHRVRRESSNAWSTSQEFVAYMRSHITDIEVGGDRSSSQISFSFERND